MGVAMYVIFKNIWKPTSHKLLLYILFFIAYISLGAVLFSVLNISEGRNEINELIEYKNEFYANHKCLNINDTEALLSQILDAYNKGIYFVNTTEYIPKWVFSGETIFFTFTLLSTIGYGHLTPATTYGHIFTIFYIVFGVPITLTLFSATVEYLEQLIFKLPKNYSNLYSESLSQEINIELSNKNRKYRRRFYIKLIVVCVVLIVFVYLLPAFILSNYTESKWSFLDSIYFEYISLTTIGLGDYVPGFSLDGTSKNVYRLIITIYLLFGILNTSLFIRLLSKIPLIHDLSFILTTRENYKSL